MQRIHLFSNDGNASSINILYNIIWKLQAEQQNYVIIFQHTEFKHSLQEGDVKGSL